MRRSEKLTEKTKRYGPRTVKVKTYRRKDGTLVSSHRRNLPK